MTVSGLIFNILTICGCWRPSSWSTSFYKRLLYNFYTIFVMFLIFTFTISQVISIGLNTDDSVDVSDDVYFILEEITSCCKMFSLIINTKDIVKLMDTITREPLQPLDDEERKIQVKFDRVLRLVLTHSLARTSILVLGRVLRYCQDEYTRNNFLIFCIIRAFELANFLWPRTYSTRGYMTLVDITLSIFISLSLITTFGKRQLMFRAWLPFDYTPFYIFCLTYAHQIFAMVIGAMLHVGLDTLICSFLIQICCQIKILENRFTKITNERKTIVKLCVRHHESIYKFASTVNHVFQYIICVQFFISTSTVCFTLHQLAKASTNTLDLLKTSLYMMCMLIQVFLYCWYGNLVTLKSQDIVNQIYNINWPDFNIDIRKSLLIIMNRTVIPITFIPMKILPMNLQLFVSILKTAYSAYNILQQTQQ